VRTFEELRSDTLRDAVKHLARAPRLWLLGFGGEEGLARSARLMLSRLRPEVHLLGGHAGAWAEDLAMAGAGDALLAIVMTPRLRLALPVLEYARTTRLRTVAVVDAATVAAARRLGALPIVCHAGNSPLGPSVTPAFSVLRLIAAALAARLGPTASRRAELIHAIREEIEELEA
jgi:DNA-binding MurR/RpiR family transcriptional regulator